jgi:hypothetical protein
MKRTRNITSKLCECDKCGEVSNSIPGATHRRCSGKKDAKPKDKYDNQLPSSSAGVWT